MTPKQLSHTCQGPSALSLNWWSLPGVLSRELIWRPLPGFVELVYRGQQELCQQLRRLTSCPQIKDPRMFFCRACQGLLGSYVYKLTYPSHGSCYLMELHFYLEPSQLHFFQTFRTSHFYRQCSALPVRWDPHLQSGNCFIPQRLKV